MSNNTSTLEWPGSKVRDTFIKFFQSKNHVFWEANSVIPLEDPTLLFTNAGYVIILQFFLYI